MFVRQAGCSNSSSVSPICDKQPRASSTSASPEEETFRVNRLRVRAEEAERRLRVVEANLAVLKSKQAAVAERENFILSELRRLSDHLLCKSCLCPSLSGFAVALFNWASLTGVQLDSGEEVRRVRLKLNAVADVVARGAPSFWSDRDRGHVLVTL